MIMLLENRVHLNFKYVKGPSISLFCLGDLSKLIYVEKQTRHVFLCVFIFYMYVPIFKLCTISCIIYTAFSVKS